MAKFKQACFAHDLSEKLAYCQSDFIWSQAEKIPATVKYFCKKFTKVFPCRPSLHLNCTDDAMITVAEKYILISFYRVLLLSFLFWYPTS